MASYGSFLQGLNAPKPPKPFGARGIPKRPRPPHGPPKLSGRLKPLPVAKPAVTPPKPPMPGPNFNDWYRTDPRFLLQHPQFAAEKASLYAQYGWQPQTDAAGNVTGYTQSTANDNPFSIVNQLSQALAGRSQNVQDTANSRGLLFSGAQVQGQQNATHDYENQLSDAQLAFQRALNGVNTNESALISDMYPDYLAQAPPASTPAAAAAAAATASTTDAAKKKAAEADRQRRIKKAQDHLTQDRIDAAKRHRRVKPPKKRKTTPGGKSTTIGSSASSLGGM